MGGNVKLPTGSSSGKDGSISLPKGTSVTRSADGTVMVDGKPLPAGIGAKVNPDGSISLASTATLPPPPKLETSSDGSLAVGSVKLPQGSEANIDGSISLPVGSKVSKNKDGSVTIDGQKLAVGTTVKTNPDGTMSIVSSLPSMSSVTTNLDGSIKLGEVSLPKGAKPSFDGSVTVEKGTTVGRDANGRITLEGQELPAGSEVRTNPDGSLSILPPPSLTVSAEQEELVAKMLASGMDEATAYQYLQQMCGNAGKGITPEAKALMEQILASNGSKEEIASRVEALLAGSELSSSRGINGGFDGTNLSEARGRGTIPQLDEDALARPGQQGSLADRIRARNAAKGARGSVKRQSEIQREKKKSRQEEREEEKLRKASYYRKVTGLRRAKVPMMVYSCGGFSRCFRVCRFYDVEGPPVGVEYEAPTPLETTRQL